MSGKASGQKSLNSKIIPKANDQRCKSDFVHVWKFVGDEINKFQFFFPTEYEYYKNDPAILFQLEDGVTPILHILCDQRKADRTLSWLKDHMQIIDQMFTIEFELEAGIFYVKEMQNMCDENNVLLVTQRAQHKAILYGRSYEKLTVLKTLFTRKKQTSPKSHSGSAIVRGQSDMKETLQKSKHSSSLYGCSASVCVTEDFKTSDMNSTSYSSDYSLKTGHESKRSRPVSAVDHYKTPPTTPSSQYNTTPSSQYSVPPTTPSSQYGVPPTTPSSQYGVPPTTPSSQYGVPPTTPSSQYGIPPTTPSSRYGVPPTTPSSQYSIPPTTPSSQYGVPPTTPSSQYGVPPTTPSSQYGVPPTTPSSQYGVPPTTPSNQYGVPPTTPSSQYGVPPTTPSSQYGVPPTTPSSQYGVPPTTPSSRYGVPPTTPSSQYGIPPTTPSSQYGVPPTTPSSQYGVPPTTPSSQYGVPPTTPSSQYGVPPTTPSSQYGVPPTTPSSRYGVPPTTPSSQYGVPPTTPSSQYGIPPTTPSSQYGVPPTTPSSQYGVPPTTPSSQYGVPPTTPSSQYGVPPTTPSSQYGIPPTTPSSRYGVPPTTPSSQYGVPPTTPSSQYGVPPTTPSSQYSIPPTTPSSQYGVPPTTPSSQYSIPPTSPSSQYSIPPTSPSSQYGVPPTSPSSQYSIPPTTPSSQYGVPPTNTAASAAVSSYEEILKLEGEDVLKCIFFRREWLNKVKNSDDYDVKLKLESTGNERLTVSCKKSVAKKAHRDIAKVRERLDEFYRESFSLDTKYLQAAKIFLQTNSDRDVLFICEDENTIILIAKEYETVVNAKNLLEISIGMKRITTRDRILSDVADPSNTDVMECPSQRLSNRPDTGFPSKDYETRPTTRIKPQFTFEFLTTEGLKVKIYTASITNLSIEAIVNTANDVLVHGGGVAKVISIAAGRRLDRESRRYVEMSGKLRVTENCVTSAGDLGYRGVIHAVGPKWRDYDRKADCLKHLYLTVKNLLVTAEKEAFRTVAMPAISAGIFGVPKDCCADMYVKAVVDFSETRWSQRTLEEFHVVDIDDKILKLVEQSYKKWQRNPADLDPIKVASSFDAQSSNVQASKTDGKSLYSAESRSNVSHLKKIKYGKAGQNVAVFKINDSLKVKVSNGDLLLVDSVDAVVCSADCHLTGTGPLSQTLAAKAGQKYCKDFSKAKEDSRKKQMEIGDVFRCKGGKLSAGNVVHVVMNAIVSCLGTEMSELRYVFRRVLEMTDEWEMQKIAMPLLGTSLLRNDRDKLENCCKALCEVVLNFRSRGQKPHLLEIHLINMNPTTTELLEKVFSMAISMHSSPRRPVTAPPAIRSDKNSPINNKRSKKAMKTKPDDEVEVDKTVAFPQNRKGLKNKLSKSDHSSSSDLEYSPGLPQEYSTQIPHGIADNNSCSKCARNLITGGGTLLSCGHILCMPCFSPISDSKSCSVCDKVDVEIDDGGLRDRKKVTDCVICMDEISNPRRLGCGHEFCQTCIAEMFKHKPACPICNTIYGMVCGNQPDGEMIVDKEITSLPGFEQYGTITINYSFLGGIQKETHPKPGQHYRGTHRTAYLPDNTEGRKVLDLLRLAFDRHLVFTIGTSRTTGQDNVVTWNDIHHKTKMYGGSERFGYPDDTYLSRVQEELAVKGITEDSLKNSTDC